MKKIFLDTNIWLRYFLNDEKKQFIDCQKLLSLNETGKLRIYTSTICLLEIVYTLSSFYKITRNQIIINLEEILSSRNLTLIERTNFPKTLEFFKKHQIKFTDCLIASQLPPKTILCTYDADFKKIKSIVSKTPIELL